MVVAIGAVALASRFGSVSTVNAVLLGVLFAALLVGAYLLLYNVRLHGRLGDAIDQIRDGVRTPGLLSVLLLLTLASWIIVALGWHACLRSLSISLSSAEILGLLSTITLAGLVSVIPGGLGIAEAGTAEYLVRAGVSPEVAQAGAIILRCFSIYAIGLGVAHLLYSGIKLTGSQGATGSPS